MTDTSTAMPKSPLGVGKIISESFSILFSNIVKVMILGFVGAFLGYLLTGLLVGFDTAAGQVDPVAAQDIGGMFAGLGVSFVITIIIYSLITAMIIQLAYDAKLGRSNSLGEYFSGAIGPLIPVIILSVVVTIAMMIGMMALIIPGLWAYAVFYVFVPAAVIEKTGFNSLGRSVALTKEYRWPIVGLFIVMGIIAGILSAIPGFIGGFLLATAGGGGSLIAFGVLMSVINAFAYGLSAIAVALTYARLREIKEGVAVDQIAAVFE
ncbi:MAG: hypothetical protein AAGF78_09005 [Pseudomonadota bacterium]